MCKGVPAASDAVCGAAPSIGRMFDRIAPTYDLLNHLLSFGRDCSWRRTVARQLRSDGVLKIVDLATGTGDLLIALLQERADLTEATGLDVSENMLRICREKLHGRGLTERVNLLRADASATPLPGGAFDAATMGFGIRNTADASKTLGEIHRILKPGGVALILEFSLPRHRVVRGGYVKYLRLVVPLVGAVISGDRYAYRYLNRSIESFHQPEAFVSIMEETGFREVSVIPLAFGVASIYKGLKGPTSG